jgi:hypothetical protein
MWAVIFVIGVVLAVGSGVMWQRVSRQQVAASRAEGDDFEPHNFSPAMRFWRLRRRAKGKGDNFLTRPVIKIGGSSRDD